ncbi:FimV/HubP family polar landmark protein [Halomonas sp. SSL-5]|uniref:FimV/HubP family polar landmark protein n=1 Tax=Halomonas sp. SSL-5 TaxID=3065855 RepID=UPI002738BEBF|nr:FimV/HubP family polar landmark protein [Halomonas sp. SSL-5]MDY7115240.1 FimV/HubP family polar landmark protein [Halomonas sp. SSL-5]
MKRKLTLAMLLSLSATSSTALALGLGEAEVRSTLNAPLRASVPLVDAGGIQPGLLNVSVADDRAYAAAGLSRTPLAASVRLAVERRQGRLVVDLTTERPVREPWLDLLLRFDWPTGQQVREVTLLLDPPNYAEMPALVTGSRQVAASSRTAQPDRQATSAATSPSPRPAATTNRDPAWVRSGDTLWGVAGRLRPDSGISMNQMMVALVAANPEAFPSGNINAMRAGITLAVPDRATITERSEADADRTVSAMNQAWANRGSGVPARVPLGGSDGSAATSVAATAPDTSPQDRASAAEETDAVASSEDAAQGEPQAVDETAAEPRLTLLTDAQLAAEQVLAAEALGVDGASPAGGEAAGEGEGGADPFPEQAGGEASPRVEIDPEWLEVLYGEGGLSEDQRLLRLENRWQQSQAQLEAVQAERDELQQDLGEMRDELAALRDQLATLTAGGSGADAPGGGGLDAAPGGEQETPWWGGLYPGALDRNLMLGGAGLAALLALWLAVRRRRGREEGASPEGGAVRVAIPGAASPVGPSASTTDGLPAADAARDDASVRASLPQAEAINEADIFIAYGRYDQARELLDANLAREPERDDLRLKLLGVHLEQGSREAAQRELATLREGGNPAVIEEAEGMMARHGLAAGEPGRVDPEPRGERADFGEAAAFPPRLFDEPSDADAEDPAAETGASMLADHEPSASPGDASPYRRPEATDDAAADRAGEQGADDEAGPAAERASPLATASTPPEATAAPGAMEGLEREPELYPEAEQEQEQEQEQEPEEASPLPEVATRRLDDGREVIDYRPPSLDDSTPTREEMPMQPSVDFTTEGLGVAEKGAGFDEGASLPRGDAGEGPGVRPLADDWDVEEVSFPPLQADNGGFSMSAAEPLAETHRLVEAGESGRARELLDELSRSDDPAIRDEALALLRRLDA